MKDALISDFNKCQMMYCEYTKAGEIEKAFDCVDMSWYIWDILEKRYGMKRADMIEKNYLNLTYYII